jgi:hypothetical protein
MIGKICDFEICDFLSQAPGEQVVMPGQVFISNNVNNLAQGMNIALRAMHCRV